MKTCGDDARVRLCAARRYAVPKKKGFKGKDQQRNARELFQFNILLPYMRPSISIIYFEFSRSTKLFSNYIRISYIMSCRNLVT
jgi:hypothetical protein